MFGVAIFLAVVAVIALIARIVLRNVPAAAPIATLVTVAAFLLAAITLGLASVTKVDAKHYGVITTFGKVSERTLAPGLHTKAPWQKVTDIDGTIKTNEYAGEKENGGDCIYVRIKDGSQGCLTATIRWRPVGSKANTIYSDFRNKKDKDGNPADPIEELRKAVVSTEFKSAIQSVLGEYNPVEAFEEADPLATDVKEVSFAPDYDKWTEDIEKEMNERIGNDPLVEIQNITISYFSLAPTTQKKIDALMAAVADTRIASQRKATATEEAAANKILTESVSKGTGVLEDKCLNIVRDAVETNSPALPDAFVCTGTAGAQTVLPIK